MTEEQPQITYYTPGQAAKRLGVSVATLAQMRRNGKIKGIEEKNITRYTQEQLDAADLSRSKPGPKTGPNSRLGRARYEWPGDKGTGENKSLDYTGKTDSENSDNFSNRWRPSLKEATDARQLVGA